MVKIFTIVDYRYVLGLTATIERLDGRHALLKQYCPVFDKVSILEAEANGWISTHKEYKVILDVDDIDNYKQMNKEFTKHFEFFNYDWKLVSSLVGVNGYKNRVKLRDSLCQGRKVSDIEKNQILKNITYNAIAFMRVVQQRKAFIMNHPKKLEIAQRIIDARPDKKIITFSGNIAMAKKIGRNSLVYAGANSKKADKKIMEEFKAMTSGVLSSCQKLNEGIDCPDLSVAILLGLDSSKIKKTQRIGRVSRKGENKTVEVFTLVINNTVEVNWSKNSDVSSNITIIDEEGLDMVLQGKQPKPYRRKPLDFTFRF